jgi:hypothetical protein
VSVQPLARTLTEGTALQGAPLAASRPPHLRGQQAGQRDKHAPLFLLLLLLLTAPGLGRQQRGYTAQAAAPKQIAWTSRLLSWVLLLLLLWPLEGLALVLRAARCRCHRPAQALGSILLLGCCHVMCLASCRATARALQRQGWLLRPALTSSP